ncbi:hypothetical protein ERJ75_000547300 [Trypanosoma vivax]|nr:hypothetical protein ERJ75_001377600 [Trypanosoma vivax]KAH8615803.1 hypothetical protein ERJ75_000547300 [Trypanosoma vivax]
MGTGIVGGEAGWRQARRLLRLCAGCRGREAGSARRRISEGVKASGDMRALALIVALAFLHACASSAQGVATGDSKDAFGRVCDVFATLVRAAETASSLAKEERSQVTAEEARARALAQGAGAPDSGATSCAVLPDNTTAHCEAVQLLARMDQAAADITHKVNKAILGDAAKSTSDLTLAAKDADTLKALLTADGQHSGNFMKADSSETNKPPKCLAQAMIFLCNNSHSSGTDERCGKEGASRSACPCASDDAHAKLVAGSSDESIGFRSGRTTKVATAEKAWEKVRTLCRTRPHPKHASTGPTTGHALLDALAAVEDALHAMGSTQNCLGTLGQTQCDHTNADNKQACVCFGDDIKAVEWITEARAIADKLQLQTHMAQQAQWEGAQIRHEAASEARRLTLDDGTQQGTTEGNATSGNNSTATDKTSSASRKTASTGHGPKGTNTQSSTEPRIATGTPLANTCRDANQRWDPEKQQCTDNAQAAYQGLMATAAAWTLLARRLAA